MNTPITEYEGDQLEIDFNLDRPEFSICPSCASQIIKLANGCGVCGWIESGSIDDDKSPSAEFSTSQKLSRSRLTGLGDKLSIPCLIKQPHKKPFEGLIIGDRGSEFDVKVNDEVQTVSKLYVFPHFPSPEKCRTDRDISPSKNSRRKKGTGSGYINWRTIKKNGKDYKQTWFHYELWDKGRQVKSCVYIPKKMRSQVEKMNNDKVPVEEILKVFKNKNKK